MHDLAGSYEQAISLTLPGGWRLIAAPRPRSTTLALHWLVDAGSRREGERRGLARLTTELVFRVARPDRGNPLDVVEELGGEASIATTREYASFQAVVAAPQGRALLALLPELARSPRLTAAALERARGTIERERRERASASNHLGELLLAALWGDTAFARPTVPEPSNLAALTPRQVRAYHTAHYRPTDTVIALAGACDLDEIAATAGLWAGQSTVDRPEPPLPPPAFAGPDAIHSAAPTDLTYLAIAVPVPGMAHPDRSALRLLDYVFGRGGSSRLYRELRERRGLAYTTASLFMPFADRGLFGAQARCAPERAPEVAALLVHELLGLASRPPTEAELRAAQQRYAGALYRSFEGNADLASLLAVETLLSRWEPFERAVARVAAVTAAQLAAVAAHYFKVERLVQVSAGPSDPGASAAHAAT
jgi:predicted Zn-dependent peptidase